MGAPHGGQTALGSVLTVMAVAQRDVLAMQAFAAKRIEPAPCQTRMRASERFGEGPIMTKIGKVPDCAKARTTGGRDGASRSDDSRLEVKLSSPVSPGTGANPEQLFAAGWSVRFVSAMRLVAASKANITVILGTERFVDGALVATALVIDLDGSIAGFQDKVQIDPSEEGTYAPGSRRRVFQVGPLTFGISICHEAWRYPETVRWAARQGAHIVFHPHFHEAEPDSYRPTSFADPANSFHEKAALCRAAENTCYFATVNYSSPGSPTTSAIVRPDGTLLSFQPYGEEGLLIADIDITTATGLFAARCRTV